MRSTLGFANSQDVGVFERSIDCQDFQCIEEYVI